MVIIGKPINGISLNGYEYLLDDAGEPKEFKSKTEAKKYLATMGVEGDDLEDCFVYQSLNKKGE
jgi:hypothetical protein|tara:strand:- start:817 stop:1008 length:192 start_codon:yes stop_codon:yes gene_type:complete